MMRAKQGGALYAMVLAWLPTSALLFRVWVHQDAVQLGYALSAEQRRAESLRMGVRELEVALAAARAPGHLTQVGGRLGLAPPGAAQIVDGGTMRPPPTPSPHLAQAEARHVLR